MSWKDNLQDATWRGIAFQVATADVTGGRRIKETERWQKRTITSDQGPVLPKFKITGYVIQNFNNDFDYFNERDRLVDALQNKRGVGILVHPFFGRLKVHAGVYTVSEDLNASGGIARFDIEFMLETEQLFPGEIKDATKLIDTEIDNSTKLNIDTFNSLFDAAAGFVDNLGSDMIYGMLKVQQAVNGVNNVLKSTINTATGVIQTAIGTITNVLDEPCDIYETLQDASESFKYLVGLGGTVIQGGVVGGCSGERRGEQVTLDGVTIPEDLGTSVIDQIVFAQDFDESDLPAIASSQQNNRVLSINIIKSQLLFYACKIIVRVTFSSQQALLRALETLIDAIDAYLLRLGDNTDVYINDLYLAMEKLKSLLYTLMLEKITTLEKEIDYTVPATVQSTLELSYNLYEDTDRCPEIFERNMVAIKHPGFMPESEIIQVLDE